MIDISVKDLVKSFDEDGNLLDGISFDVQSGERVGLLGKNGAGKTTLFKILTGEIDYNSGAIAFAQGKKVGLISQIPVYPADYTVNDVLRAAFSGLDRIKARMRELEGQMTEHTPKEILLEYDALTNRFEAGGGYEIDTETDKICNGLAIPQSQREQLFSSLSGGEKTRVNLGAAASGEDRHSAARRADQPSGHACGGVAGGIYFRALRVRCLPFPMTGIFWTAW